MMESSTNSPNIHDGVAKSPYIQSNISVLYRNGIAELAKREANNDTLCISADSLCRAINRIFSQTDDPILPELLEERLFDLWYTVYHASLNISCDNPYLDRLALQIVQLREQGTLQRRGPDLSSEEATTSGGRIWADLPFFVSHMTQYWIGTHATISGAQRLSFSKFLAMLACAGLVDDGLGGICLLIMRDTLETQRLLGRLLDQEQAEQPSRTPQDVTIAALLPAANAWLGIAGTKLVQLSEQGWCGSNSSAGQPGDLLRDHGPEEELTSGFSTARWLFWLKRLEEIAVGASAAGDGGLARYSERMMDNMIFCAEEYDTDIRRALNGGGVVKYQPRVYELRGPGETE